MFWLFRMWRRLGGWRAIVAQVLLAWELFRDPRVPLLPKLILPGAIVLILAPFNLPFEFIPFIGQVDTIGIILLGLGAFLKACPEHLVREHALRLEQEMQAEVSHRFRGVSRFARPTFARWTGSESRRSSRVRELFHGRRQPPAEPPSPVRDQDRRAA